MITGKFEPFEKAMRAAGYTWMSFHYQDHPAAWGDHSEASNRIWESNPYSDTLTRGAYYGWKAAQP